MGGNYPDYPTNKPGHAFIWHTQLSICLQRTPLQKSGEQKEAPAAHWIGISEYYDISARHPLMSLGVIMFTWTWNKTTKLIYSEDDLLYSKTAREFIALWHSLALNHAVKVQSSRRMKPLMWRHLYCTLIASSCYGICILHFKWETQSLITKCHNKWLQIINNINYHCAPYSFTKQSMRVESFFFHQDPINSMQLPNSWWHFDSKSSLLSSVSIIKIRCCNHLSLQ